MHKHPLYPEMNYPTFTFVVAGMPPDRHGSPVFVILLFIMCLIAFTFKIIGRYAFKKKVSFWWFLSIIALALVADITITEFFYPMDPSISGGPPDAPEVMLILNIVFIISSSLLYIWLARKSVASVLTNKVHNR